MAHWRDRATRVFELEMDAGMSRMMEEMHAPSYTGQPDTDFLAMMIAHHAGAVEIPSRALAC